MFEREKPQRPLNGHHHRSVLDLSAVPIHLGGIDHETAVIAGWSSHKPFPKHIVNAIPNNLKHVDPGLVRDKVPDQSPSSPRQEPLICLLHVIKINRLGSVCPVTVSKDVKAWLYSPHFTQQVRATQVEVKVVFL